MKKIIVIGAGAAGMYAAYLLNRLEGVEVQVLEAKNQYGGRIRTLEGFADFPIELGAEEVHGRKSILGELLDYSKTELIRAETEGEDYYWYKNELISETELEQKTDFQQFAELIENRWEYEGEEISVQQYFFQQGFDPYFYGILEGWISTEYGAPLSKIGMASLADSERRWKATGGNWLIRNRSYLSIFEEVFAEILPKIKLNEAVQSIDYQKDTVLIQTQNQTYEADAVILTVPLSILKKGKITFIPDLSTEKQQAIEKIGIEAGMKIFLRFEKRFWEEDTFSMYGGENSAEFWVSGFGKSAKNNILTTIANGERAEYFSGLGEKCIDLLIQDLEKMFPTENVKSLLSGFYIMDWGKEPFIEGLYSYPSFHSQKEREILAKNTKNKLFWAGEATNTEGHFSCVHGAMETAERAVAEIIEIGKIQF